MKKYIGLPWLLLLIIILQQVRDIVRTECGCYCRETGKNRAVIEPKPNTMSAQNLTKTFRELYTAKSTPALIFVPAGHYIAISGKGDPDGETFAASTQALYTAAYSIRKIYKQMQQEFTVSKLEGLWWVANEEELTCYEDALKVPRDEWHWQLLIRMPDFVVSTKVQEALQEAFAKKRYPLLKKVSLISLAEGKSVQVLHTGPYASEPVTLALMETFIKTAGLEMNGRHHEIYLSDPRKTAPEKLRTILRQPVR